MAVPLRDGVVRVGDYVSFKFPKYQCYLSAEGILVEDVFVSPDLTYFDEHVYQIYVQRQYSATNELEEFIRVNGEDTAGQDASVLSHMEALVRGKDNETVLNKTTMRNKLGNKVCFGDTIQLLHVKSNKFVMVNPSDLARDERENMRVSLGVDGSVLSWIKIMPRFKINREGEPVTNGTEILLKVSERANEFLHCADRPPPKGRQREVNSSLDAPTGWKITIFQAAEDIANTTLLLTGQLVYIRDPESQSMLAPLARPLALNLAHIATAASTHSGNGAFSPTESNFFESPWNSSQKFAMVRDDDESTEAPDDISLSSLDEFVRDHGCVAFRPAREDMINSDALWMMESKSISKGGLLKYKTDSVHFRHLNTGLYLSLTLHDDSSDTFTLSLDHKPSERHTLFSISELHSGNDFLNNARAVQIRHSFHNAYLERGHYNDSQKVFSCAVTRNRTKAISVILNRYVQKDKVLIKKISATGDEALDIYFSKATAFHLAKYCKALSFPGMLTQDTSTIWPRMDKQEAHLFSTFMARITLFVRGFPIRVKMRIEDLAQFQGGKHVVMMRQNMMREVGVLQIIMTMIKALQPLTDLMASDASTNRFVKAGFVEMGKDVLSECLQLLYVLVKKNTANQLFIADHLLVILEHVSSDKTAAKVAQELLSSNRELQETKIGRREIGIFTDKVRDTPMNAMYLQLLRTCCSCAGEGLPKNQETVNTILFGGSPDALIAVVPRAEAPIMIDWGINSHSYEVFVHAHLVDGTVRGHRLCSEGLPLILVSWKTKSSRFAVDKLFDKPDVPINEIFVITSTLPIRHNAAGPAGGVSKSSTKRAIADFLVAQLQLAAEMCLGRNYPIIQALEKLYSYELLVTLLRLQIGEDLSSAVAYLLLCLYVDREPQSEVPLPRLTRTITEVVKLNGNELVHLDKARSGQFALVQLIISNHLTSICNMALATHTSNIVKLLHSLVKFNFYGNIDKMKDVIESLMKCLKRGDFDLHDVQDGGISQSVRKLTAQSRAASRRSSNRTANGSKPAALTTQQSSQGGLVADTSNRSLLGTAQSGLTFVSAGQKSLQDGSLAHLLESLESLTAQYFMIAFLLFTIAISAYIHFEGVSKAAELAFEVAVFTIFTGELLLNVSLHLLVHRNILLYLSKWYHLLDFLAVVLYAVAFIGVESIALFANLGRLTRFVTLLRMLVKIRSARNTAAALGKDSHITWVTPERYVKTSESSMETLVQMVHVLYTIQTNVEDWRISLVLSKFSKWAQDMRSGSDQVGHIFEDVIKRTVELSVASSEDGDDTLIDLLMYHHPPLVQSTLELLMTHHSSAKHFLENLSKLQLITSNSGESKYSRLEHIVYDLKRDVDTHEIWGKLESSEQRKISTDMHKNLTDLIHECRKTREVLRFDEKYEPVPFIQNVLRNLGCFPVCFKIAQLVLLIDKDDVFKECHLNTRNLSLTANHLLFWFALDNPMNQSLAYNELKFFIKTIDHKIDSHKVISAMFRNNIDLMESVPKKYIEEFVDMICNIGRFPQYLSLMSSIISVGEKNVIGNQYAVIKMMNSPDNQKKILHFFIPVTHPDYAKKVRLMSHYLQAGDVSVDDLPSDLAYHLELMGLLSSCTIGTSGMTTIEAKVQSMFNFVDVIDAMLDPQCLLLAKVRLGLFLYNGMLDVETPLPALKDADAIWKLLIAAQDVFTFAKDDLRSIEKNGWDAPTSCRQKIEYMLVNAMIVESYFTAYYDHTIFKPEAGQATPGVERMQLKEPQANMLIQNLYSRVVALYEMLSPLLAVDHHKILHGTLVALNNAAKEKLIADVPNLHDTHMQQAKEYAEDGNKTTSKSFEEFLQCLHQNEYVQKLVDKQIQCFIDNIEKLPWKASVVVSGLVAKAIDVRFEPLVERLVCHVRGCIQIVVHGDDTIKFMDPSSTKTCIWVLRIFRTMVENRWGMSIYERDDDGGEEQDNAVAELMNVYNDSQMSEMCLDLIAKGIDIALQSEALKLLVAMLFKEGGALNIQKSIFNHLNQQGSDIFFRTVRQMLSNLMSWHTWNGVVILTEGSATELPDELILVRCLQLMCEGHYRPNQDIMREQPNNNGTVNLLDDFVMYLQTLDAIKCRTSTTAALSVAATILEVIQGPCEGNQEYFALNTELIETLNRVTRQHPVNDCDETQELMLKKAAIDIFQALLEGQARKTAVYERMLSVIHVDVILVLCRGSEGARLPNGKMQQESIESIMLRTESLVLMQMLTDFRPSLKKELDIDDDVSKLTGDSVACIEVVWRGELQRRFFHIPDICSALAKSTKDSFVLTVKRASPEDKLYGLLEASKEMYREISHQQLLKSFQLDKLFSRTNQDRVIWANFYVVLCINVLFVVFLDTVVDGDCSASDDGAAEYLAVVDPRCSTVRLSNDIVRVVIRVLNIVLICGAAFALASSLLVRAPVSYQAYVESDYNMAKSLLLTAMEFSTVYYFGYLAMAAAGLVYYPLLSFLLLDFITMSPTAQGVLQAVFKPRRQIFMTLILTFIIIYVFAVFSFFFLAKDNYGDDTAMATLGNSFRWLLRWALPFFSGVNYMDVNGSIFSLRIINDLAFFLTCTVMLNILKGITIDTFVELRKALESRMEDTTERCFVCGIDKNTFNRTLDRDAFRNHIKHDQNLWNYVFFIIYIWEQDKDDDDGLESFVRKCIQQNDLTWFPLNKAIRLAEFQEKGDVHSLKYRFRQNLQRSEGFLASRMADFRDQVNRTLTRVEKSLEYEIDPEIKRGASRSTRNSVLVGGTRGSFASRPQSQSISLAAPNSARSNISGNGRQHSRGHEVSSLLFSAIEGNRAVGPGPQRKARLMGLGSSFGSVGSHGLKAASAMDADFMGQMHVRLVSIAGLLLEPEHIRHVVVEVISARHRGSVRPITDVRGGTPQDSGLPMRESLTPYGSEQVQASVHTLKRTHSSIMDSQMLREAQIKARQVAAGVNDEWDGEDGSRAEQQLQAEDEKQEEQEQWVGGLQPLRLMFDMIDNPAILVHEGPLPRSDLSNFIVKVQVRFTGSGGASSGLLGVVRVPFIDLLAKAHEGRPAEVVFDQRPLEVCLATAEEALVDFDDTVAEERRLRLPGRRGVLMSLSVIASHRLLEDFSLVS